MHMSPTSQIYQKIGYVLCQNSQTKQICKSELLSVFLQDIKYFLDCF